MRPLAEWDETDLIALVTDQVQESVQLDYKASPALARTSACMTELAKDVSAFANSAGGRIIYGITENANVPTGIDDGCDPADITREWIEQVLNSRIQPRISGMRIKAIPLTNSRFAFVIDIPQATTFAPHQANYRYYRRFNFMSVAMEDYEIKDAMRRASVGDPYVRFGWVLEPIVDGMQPKGRLTAHAGNLSSEPIMYALVKLLIDQRLIPLNSSYAHWELKRNIVGVIGQQKCEVVLLTRNVMPNFHMPLFRETEWLMWEDIIDVPSADNYVLSFEVFAPAVNRRLGGLFQIDGADISPAAAESEDLLTAGLPPTTINVISAV